MCLPRVALNFGNESVLIVATGLEPGIEPQHPFHGSSGGRTICQPFPMYAERSTRWQP
jgi:hypothetical protein